jgi:hypothetical protein
MIHEIEDIEAQVSSRSGLDGIKHATQQMQNQMNNFETGALKDAKDAFVAAQGAMEGKAAGTQEFIDAEKAL